MDFSLWMDLIENHRKLYPQMTDQDVYKLLYQGLLGSKHLLKDRLSFMSGLEKELTGLKPDSDHILYEPIRPDGRLARIHLRAWLTSGKCFDVLLHDCLTAAEQTWNRHDEFIDVWRHFQQTSQAGMTEFSSKVETEGFPPVHHSPIFREVYSPAYRLVMI